MKRIILLLLVISVYQQVRAQQPHQAIGIRLGDPMGVTYKSYLPRHKAVEFGIGTSPGGWHQNYYENSFRTINKYENYRYRSHRVESTLYLQARYLMDYDIPIEGMEGKLEWYWGIGGLLKISKVKYWYELQSDPFDGSEVRNDLDFGPEGIAGMEYTFQGIPITVFGELSLMIELVDRAALRPFSGVGVRYNF